MEILSLTGKIRGDMKAVDVPGFQHGANHGPLSEAVLVPMRAIRPDLMLLALESGQDGSAEKEQFAVTLTARQAARLSTLLQSALKQLRQR